MLAFELISSQNETVECMAYGWNADSDTLVEGHKVAVHGKTVAGDLRRPRWGHAWFSRGILWFANFQNAFIHALNLSLLQEHT